MTHEIFDKKFNSAYVNALEQYCSLDVLKSHLSKYSDENNKLPSENMLEASVMVSLAVNKSILKSVLIELLEVDQ